MLIMMYLPLAIDITHTYVVNMSFIMAIFDCPREKWPNSHLVMIVEIPALKI